jgi:predicted dehydrogenase/threonine dehydrogenase-like Zn-dependent dehydrogenase
LRQVVQNFKTGIVSVDEIAIPQLREGCLRVKNKVSLISAGTEGGTVKLGKLGYLGKARARPEQVKKVLQALRTEGLLTTFSAVTRTLDVPIPLGYSCAGVVESTWDKNCDISVGTPVACGGAGMALHADYVVVPRNLCVPVPHEVSLRHAAFTTVGAIAMQSVRIADVRLGENVVVIGLGLVGLLVATILKAGGIRVFGIDTNPQRVAWAEKLKICRAAVRDSENLADRILEFTGGYGADASILTAGTPNNDPVALAGDLSRYKGRVVVVGRTVMEAPRETYLFKELELMTSYAYGPGTEDPSYEAGGYDYPIGYVRWTENRNMQCFLDLLNDKKIDIEPLVTHSFPIKKAPDAFDIITTNAEQSVGVVLEYDDVHQDNTTLPRKQEFVEHSKRSPSSGLRVGIIGAGSFATNIMIPLLAKRTDIAIQAIASANGLRASALSRKYNIPVATSDADEILTDDGIDCVFILTRHGTHASFAQRGLLANKHVFVEKPLALTHKELEGVVEAQDKSMKVLMVGFNRRFSPLAQRMKHFFSDRCQPMMIKYRGNVGYRPPEHWLHDPVDGGGIILGEACHYIDYCRWMADSPIVSVNAQCLGQSNTKSIPEDNVIITLEFGDGSLAEISYISNGAKGFSRERCEAHADERSAVWEDFKYVKLVKDLGLPKTSRKLLFPNKGYQQELNVFFSAIQLTDSSEINWLSSQIDTSRAAIAAAECIRKTSVT